MNVQSFEVCVFGAGPAGMALGIRLSDLGITSVVLARLAKPSAWRGESLTGAIRQPLTTLGLWQDFQAAGHVPGYEQRTAWGGPEWVKSSMLAVHGHFWHVDRQRFDTDLREAAQRRGVPLINYSRLQQVQGEDHGWQVRVNEDSEIRCRFLIDATGRSRVLARALGARPRLYDRLIAFASLLPRNTNPDFDHAMLLEATPLGWWYAAPVPQGHVLAFFTDPDLAPRQLARFMKPVSANSSFLQSQNDDRWLAVGDACAAHDPLCGWGVCRAMSNGILAADAVRRYVRSDDGSAIEDYRRHCHEQFTAYLAGLTRRYSYEQRWASAPFWARRCEPPRQRA
jgi:flavin-dependent dehydrogenase